jgi:hypothetical protein
VTRLSEPVGKDFPEHDVFYPAKENLKVATMVNSITSSQEMSKFNFGFTDGSSTNYDFEGYPSVTKSFDPDQVHKIVLSYYYDCSYLISIEIRDKQNKEIYSSA